MSKHNSLIKKVQHQILSINQLIERYFTYFKNLKQVLKN